MVSIVSDTQQLVFVHIPKCAGASITKMLQPLVGWDKLVEDAEANRRGSTGRIIRQHTPLKILSENYPDELERMERYRCYAVTRNPMDRFVSSVSQHLRNFHNRELVDLSAQELAQTVDGVIRQMGKTPLRVPREYIHFTRQIDYVSLDGRQVVRNLYRMETLDQLVADISRFHTMDMALSARKNEAATYNSQGLKVLMRTGGTLARNMLPTKTYRTLRRWARDKTTTRIKDNRPDLFHSETVQAFCEEFYAPDFPLWEQTGKLASAATDPAAF